MSGSAVLAVKRPKAADLSGGLRRFQCRVCLAMSELEALPEVDVVASDVIVRVLEILLDPVQSDEHKAVHDGDQVPDQGNRTL